MSERSGIEIDYCPQCRGVWLDRGELDKIIERSVSAPQPPAHSGGDRFAPPAFESQQAPRRDERRYDDRPHYDEHGQRPYRRKRESWLSDLFD